MTNKTMQELTKIEEELQAILMDGKQKEQEYMAEIETAEQNEEEAKRAVIEAGQNGTATEYAKANQDLRTAKDIVQFYSGKIEKLKDDPYITEAEYEDYTMRIKSEMDKTNEQGLKRTSKVLQELEAIKDEFAPAYPKTNELLKNLQNNIYKYSAEKQKKEARENKTSISADKLKNEYQGYSIAQSLRNLLESNSAQYIKTKGGE